MNNFVDNIVNCTSNYIKYTLIISHLYVYNVYCISFIAERGGMTEPKKVEGLQTRLINTLRDHVTFHPEAQRKPQYLSRILDRLPQLRSLSVQVKSSCTLCKYCIVLQVWSSCTGSAQLITYGLFVHIWYSCTDTV